MQLFVRESCAMIAAPVQRDVDGIPKGSHYVRVPIAIGQPNKAKLSHRWVANIGNCCIKYQTWLGADVTFGFGCG
jgi:hypothetical protein